MIEAIKDKLEIKVKRFYLPLVIKDKCPNCDGDISCDLEEQYLSFPTLNKTENITLCCEECALEFHKPLTLRLSVDIGDLEECD